MELALTTIYLFFFKKMINEYFQVRFWSFFFKKNCISDHCTVRGINKNVLFCTEKALIFLYRKSDKSYIRMEASG